MIENELCYLFSEQITWKVKELDAKEFLITFPNEETRRQLTRFEKFEFKIAQVMASMKATNRPSEASSVLQPTGLKLSIGILRPVISKL